MISLIKFDYDLVIPKAEAEKLGLNHDIIDGTIIRVGVKRGEERIEIMRSCDHYYDDEHIEEITGVEGEKQEYLNKRDGKKLATYYLYNRVPFEGFVHVKGGDNHLVDLFKFAPICRHPYKIIKTVKSEQPTIQNIEYLLHTLGEKIEGFNKTVDIISNNTFNERTNVHIGGGLLASYNELLLRENVCTDALQGNLNDGWRIIAVCVQPDQRRPDYILGRYNPDLNVCDAGEAKRG